MLLQTLTHEPFKPNRPPATSSVTRRELFVPPDARLVRSLPYDPWGKKKKGEPKKVGLIEQTAYCALKKREPWLLKLMPVSQEMKLLKRWPFSAAAERGWSDQLRAAAADLTR